MGRPGASTVTAARSPNPGPNRGIERDPWASWVLAVVTLGVYGGVVHYRTNRELRDYGLEVRPALSVVAFFPGCLVLVPFLVTVHRTAERIEVAQEIAGLRPSIHPARCTATALFALVHIPYQQSQLNRAWRADALQEVPR